MVLAFKCAGNNLAHFKMIENKICITKHTLVDNITYTKGAISK